MKLLFDNTLAPKLARSLNLLVEPEHTIMHLKDRFTEANIADNKWLAGLEDDWAILTGDLRVGRNPHEMRAWKEVGHTVFFLRAGWTQLTFWEQATRLTKRLPDILKVATKARHGSSFSVAIGGKIQKVS